MTVVGIFQGLGLDGHSEGGIYFPDPVSQERFHLRSDYGD